MTEGERRYEQYHRMAWKLAHKIHRRFRHYSREELLTEAESAIILAKGYDPNKGAESTWMHNTIYWHLLDYVKAGRQVRMVCETDYGETPNLPARPNRLMNILQDLGQEARELIEVIITAPADIADDVSTATKGRGRIAVREYLLKQGWSPQKLNRAWAEALETVTAEL
jgi:hypothetical protein